MVKVIKWQASSERDRMTIIEEVKEAISSSNGYILNFNMFSNLALSLSIEIEPKDINGLHQTLSNVLDKITFLEPNTIVSRSKKEQLILLNISFMAATGNLKIETPAVPG